ncbi:MAG: hypothetical protein Faunusvirus1_70 [Faunusvirus sp.]|jgi:hypothetical protein|uniref:Uncharacterized protein n=1 Tax=Faunusvirus sp. TaxID=2487766 RepID=A0A3G4ZW18_9VIRU|nr:MAG: hypothetical protein Faunusvirus1_70 [Faunusvirus sp.]
MSASGAAQETKGKTKTETKTETKSETKNEVEDETVNEEVVNEEKNEVADDIRDYAKDELFGVCANIEQLNSFTTFFKYTIRSFKPFRPIKLSELCVLMKTRDIEKLSELYQVGWVIRTQIHPPIHGGITIGINRTIDLGSVIARNDPEELDKIWQTEYNSCLTAFIDFLKNDWAKRVKVAVKSMDRMARYTKKSVDKLLKLDTVHLERLMERYGDIPVGELYDRIPAAFWQTT